MSAANTDPRNFIDEDKFPRLESLMVSRPVTFMRAGPRPSAAAATEMIYGDLFHVHKRGRGWVWGQMESGLTGRTFPGYVGWVRRSDLSDGFGEPTHKTTGISAPVFSKPDIKSHVKFCLPMNSVLMAEPVDNFFEFGPGYLHKEHALGLEQGSRHMDWISIAESLIGQPYIWGGVSSFGLDCSGLVQTALRTFGFDTPRDSDQQTELGQEIKVTDKLSGLKRGDLIFWKGHVGIMTSPSRLLHANAHHMMVAVEPLSTAQSRIAEIAGPITAIRRIDLN